jgi:hypothetical protein
VPFQAVPDACLFTVHFTGPDGTTPSFELVSRDQDVDWDLTRQTAVGAALEAAVITDYVPLLPNDTTFSGISSRDLSVQYGLVVEHTVVPTVGGLASPSLPAEVAIRVAFKGTPGAPPDHGGMYLLPPGESQVVGSIVQAGPLASLQTAAANMAGAMNNATGDHVIISRYQGTVLTPGPNGTFSFKPVKRATAVTNTVVSVTVRNMLASQKPRRPKL